MKNKKSAGFKMKKSAAKMFGFAAAAGQNLYRSSQMPMPNYTPNTKNTGPFAPKRTRLRTWDDYFDQDRFDSRAVNKRLTKSQRQAKIAQKKKDFEKEQATIRAQMQDLNINYGRPRGGTQYPGKPNFYPQMMGSLNQGVMGGGPRRPRKFSGGVSQVGNMVSQLAPFTMKRGSKPSKSEFFKGKK